MTADLRRLAERTLSGEITAYIDHETARAILALLDERDHDRALIGTLAEDQALAERRVAVLEEGLRDMVRATVNAEHGDGWSPEWLTKVLAPARERARALLTSAPTGVEGPAAPLLDEQSDAPDQLADLRQLVNEPGPVCDIPWAAGPANAMCLRCGNRFDEHTQAQPESEAGDE